MQLPRDTTEIWLDAQEPKRGRTTHEDPPGDIMEAWVESRVKQALGQRKPRM
ncbi:MAG: hypothetical protein KGI26_04130 [Thaumarchaeota archaeon]|nr:hypothetical protein [Nitrososphaerota archaeon]